MRTINYISAILKSIRVWNVQNSSNKCIFERNVHLNKKMKLLNAQHLFLIVVPF